MHRSSHGFWALTRRAEVMRVLRDPGASTDRREDFRRKLGSCPYMTHVDNNLFYRGGDDHARLRGPFTRAFSGRAITGLRPGIRRRAGDLAASLDPDGFDLVGEFAKPLPVATIAALLGVGPEHHDDLTRWSYALVDALEPGASAEVAAAADDATTGFKTLLAGLLAARREEPVDDLLSALAVDEDCDLTDDELLHNAIFLLSAGHDTTTALITGAIEWLADAPDQWRVLREDRALVADAVEELARLVSPAQMIGRRLAAPSTVGGVELDAGRPILLWLAAANRDPSVFPDPDALDVRRPNAKHHIAFGFGPHVCLGAPLAREQVRAALDALLDRFTELQVVEAPHRAPSSIIVSYRQFRLKGSTA